jgi:hypothetical protein
MPKYAGDSTYIHIVLKLTSRERVAESMKFYMRQSQRRKSITKIMAEIIRIRDTAK